MLLICESTLQKDAEGTLKNTTGLGREELERPEVCHGEEGFARWFVAPEARDQARG